jgi:hypothetical protein
MDDCIPFLNSCQRCQTHYFGPIGKRRKLFDLEALISTSRSEVDY